MLQGQGYPSNKNLASTSVGLQATHFPASSFPIWATGATEQVLPATFVRWVCTVVTLYPTAHPSTCPLELWSVGCHLWPVNFSPPYTVTLYWGQLTSFYFLQTFTWYTDSGVQEKWNMPLFLSWNSWVKKIPEPFFSLSGFYFCLLIGSEFLPIFDLNPLTATKVTYVFSQQTHFDCFWSASTWDRQ